MATDRSTGPITASGGEALRTHRLTTRLLDALEVSVAVIAVVASVVLDRLIPSLVLLLLMTVSLVLRRQRLSSLGLARVARAGRMALVVFALTVGWTLLTLAVTMPLLERLTGQRQDVSDFADLKGDLATTLILIVLSWTLAAVGEELAFRGYLQTRMREVMPPGTAGLVVAVVASSALFGLIHTEQGAVGVGLTFVDALFFSVLRYRYRTLWAAVLAHGFSNTIGLTAYFLVGPVYGLW